MVAPDRRKTRCAIYTRKSSEEGLEQDFNSLHAQREACEAYVASQKHEGWQLLKAVYDDGGFSGGSMERPALQRLLADIAAGGIDVVVVYKVDRLTRSLTDFAKIVDVFDGHSVSFVSVTQAFNTTSSMGRLTLNVLLSFAQFEREVTGERIRDKIAASKKKGLWMGGNVPVGYRAAGRTLIIDEPEAETIRTIYARYLELRSVDALKTELDSRGFRTRLRAGQGGRVTGGTPFSRGHLYRILSGALYAGKIEHKGTIHDGQHPAIVDQETFDAVQAMLSANSHARLVKAHSKDPALLSGLLVDANGVRLVASHARNHGRRYRYYVSTSNVWGRPPNLGRGGDYPTGDRRRWRLPAAEIEGPVMRMLIGALTDEHWLADHVHTTDMPIAVRQSINARVGDLAGRLQTDDPISRRGVILRLVQSVELRDRSILVRIATDALREPSSTPSPAHTSRPEGSADATTEVIERAFELRRRGSETRLVIEGDDPLEPEPDPALCRALGQAHRWWRDLLERRYPTLRALARAYGTDERYAAFVLRLAFLPAELTRGILEGQQPPELTLHELLTTGAARQTS